MFDRLPFVLVNDSAVRAATAQRAWRMRQWPNDPTIAHLVFLDHHLVPTSEQLEQAIGHARRRGARAIRTSALFPAATRVVLDRGFATIDRLALLRRQLASIDDLTTPDVRTRPMLAWHHRLAAQLDRAAFGPMWGNDATSLREIRAATPEHRARLVRRDGSIAGFAISGAAGDHGYLQRLAVDPTMRRQGIGHGLVIDALAWMHEHGLRTALVNTGQTNGPALGLYAALGFEQLDDELIIAELSLD